MKLLGLKIRFLSLYTTITPLKKKVTGLSKKKLPTCYTDWQFS